MRELDGQGFPKSFPSGIVTDSRGFIYVTDSQDPSVVKFSSSGEIVGHLLDHQLHGPVGLAADSQDNLYFLDDGWVIMMTSDGSLVRSWDVGSSEAVSIAVSGVNGDIYVGGLRWISRFTRDGRLIGGWGGAGTGNGQFLSWTKVAVNPLTGDVYVSGGGAWGGVVDDRIQVFTPEGGFIFSWWTRNSNPCALTFDNAGNIFEIGCLTSRVQEFAIVQIPVPVQLITWGNIKALFR